jgi:hypothetical protein
MIWEFPEVKLRRHVVFLRLQLQIPVQAFVQFRLPMLVSH